MSGAVRPGGVEIDMVRDDFKGVPQFALPQGYRFRMWRPGDDETWTALQVASEPYINVTPELYVRQFKANEDALPERMYFVETEAGEAVASITAWWERDRYNPAERGRIHWVVVHPAHQRRGITKPMMTRAMAKLAEHHSTAMLGTHAERVWAVKVYLDFGFYPDPKQWERPEVQAGWRSVQAQLNHPLLGEWIGRQIHKVDERPMINVDELSFTYPGRARPAVHSVSFQVGKGEIFGFLGPSGAGKSTTQKVLVGILKSYAGRVAMMGRDLQDWGRDYYERIGVSFELPNHYLKLTALENLSLFRALYRGETEDPQSLLERLGLGNDGNTPVGAFSKGMQMRLNLARALLHMPELLFLDEPTSGLDPANARNVRRIVLDLKAQGRTIFLTTHDMHVADELCDRVAFMVDGSISVVNSPRSLKLKHGQPTVRVEYGNGAASAAQEFPLPGIGANEEFLALMRDAKVETIHSQEATLEDVFLSVTGRSLA